MAANDDSEPFLYTADGPPVPNWATHVRVAPGIESIPEKAFHGAVRFTLRHVELCDGLQTIGRAAFFDCSALESVNIPGTIELIPDECFQHCNQLSRVQLQEGLRGVGMHAFDGCTSLGHITLPSTVRAIGKNAFFNSVSSIILPDRLERIGDYAFSQCTFPCLRVPPRITEIAPGAFRSCKNLFTAELPETGIEHIQDYSFASCHSLRNVFIPANSTTAESSFQLCTDLEKALGANDINIQHQLRHRFDGLPVHRMCYFQSYASPERAIRNLNEAMDETCEHFDCLGMTPLHILACSSTQQLELYRMLVERYPNTLIDKDKWDCLPILYAFWRRASAEILQYLIESIKAAHPEYELNWDTMVETLSKAHVPHRVIQDLLDARSESFSDQRIDWESILNKFTEPIRNWKEKHVPDATFRYLVSLSVEERVATIGLREWRSIAMDSIQFIRDGHRTRSTDLGIVSSKVAFYEEEYRKLKEATSTLELFLWKTKIAEMDAVYQNHAERRSQCRVSCQADNVIENVLPYLLPSEVGSRVLSGYWSPI
ncbi:hypothetical protein ACHAXT_011499 [Thalassiosira profunda]